MSSHRQMVGPGGWRIGLGLALVGLPACGPVDPKTPAAVAPAYAQMLRVLYRRTVPTVAPAALAAELRAADAPLLLDARSPAEFRVSHLAGARFVNYDSLAAVKLPGVDRHRPMVVYCSVGYRSERLGERLQALGFKQVRNLYGGLFEWVNEGHPVVNARGTTPNVHPYSALWSPWLRRGRKVYE